MLRFFLVAQAWGLVLLAIFLAPTCTKAVLAAPPVSHSEQGTFGMTEECLHWCAIYEDGTYDAWATEGAMNAALPTLPYAPAYCGPDSGPAFEIVRGWFSGLRPRLTTHIICAGAESVTVGGEP
jgi:hypothetical protein